MAVEKKNPLGATGDEVRANVQRIREGRGLTKKELSDLVGARGRPIPPLGIARIEAGTRRVDADDLVALATALAVSPMTLLLPWTEDPAAEVEVTAIGRCTADLAWQWADGRHPANLSDHDPGGDLQRYRLDSRPAWARSFLRYVSWMEISHATREKNLRNAQVLAEMNQGGDEPEGEE